MDAALVGIPARRQIGNGIGTTRLDGAGVEGAASGFLKTSVVGDGVVRGGRIIPSDRAACGHGCGSRHIVWGPAIHEDVDCRRGRGGRPSH